eukprot:112282-Amorphochlora_amoeboformis.AAC.1
MACGKPSGAARVLRRYCELDCDIEDKKRGPNLWKNIVSVVNYQNICFGKVNTTTTDRDRERERRTSGDKIEREEKVRKRERRIQNFKAVIVITRT